MKCSKMFSGDLPELINEIIQHFQNDLSTLHSCVLVNRLWCRLAVPLLWEDPFLISNENYHFIEIYLHNLNDGDKNKLSDYGISNSLFPSETLFNYPSFIKYLNTYKIVCSIEKWVAAVRTLTVEEQSSNYSTENSNLSPTTHPNFENSTRLIYRSLFKTFIDNEITLHTFEVVMIIDIDYDYFNDALELILQNPNFVRNIKNLRLYLDVTKIYPFLKFLNSNCNSISSLYFQLPKFNILIEKHLSQIIYSQQNLKKISFEHNSFPLNNSLLSLKNSNCSNTLKKIIFHGINFKNIVIFKEAFEQLNVLESIHILYCRSLNTDFIQQIVNITKPFKLKSLFLCEKHFQIEPLLQKSGDYLENFGAGAITNNENNESDPRQLFELITKYCTKIKFVELFEFDNQDMIYSSFDLIKNIEQNLSYLSIDINDFYSSLYNNHLVQLIEFSSIILQNLGQILPFKLEYLSLSLIIKISDFEIFLKNSQNNFIKKLLIKNKMQEESENILPYIKEYIMVKKMVRYLAILEFEKKNENNENLLKDEVKEFESYNIQILNYDDLYIQAVDYIKEID